MMEFMDGASGRKAANYLYGETRWAQDRLRGSHDSRTYSGPAGKQYDIDKFIYLGSTETGNPYVLFTRKATGIDSLEKLRSTSGMRIGAHSVGHSVYVTARMFAYYLNFKDPKFVVGFTDPEMDVAMGAGELDARTSSNVDSLFRKDIRDAIHFPRHHQ